jgi:6-phosphogluconolactonase
MSVDIRVVDDPVQECVQALVRSAAAGEHVVLAGGSTPKAAYERAAAEHARAFAGARLWFGDERCVPPDDDRSNYKMVVETLLEPLAAADVHPEFCHRMVGELGFAGGAVGYEEELRSIGFGISPDVRFGLVLLGLGPDGHTLSLFPEQATLLEQTLLVVGVPSAGHEPFVPRISLSFPALRLADEVMLLTTGAEKAEAVSAAFADEASPSALTPASMLAEYCRSLTVVLDEDAAARL